MPILTTLGAACAKAWGFTSGLVKDQYFNLVSLLLPGNGTNGAQNNTFLDSSTNNFTITRNGNTTQGTFSPFSQTGWGNYFDGSTTYLQINTTSATLAFSTGDFTIEGWFYFTSTPQVASNPSIVSSNSGGFIGWRPTTTGIEVYTPGVGAAVASDAFTIPINQWIHMAVVRESSSMSFYLNGARQGAAKSNTNNYAAPTSEIIIGRTGTGGPVIPGYISNLRVTKGRAVYSGSSYTVPTVPLTRTTGGTNPPQGTECSLLTCQSNRFLDSNGVNTPASSPFTIIANNSPSVVAFSPFAPTAAYTTAAVGGSGYFDGTGDYLTAPSNIVDFAAGQAFTVECWVYLSSNTPAQAISANGANTFSLAISGGQVLYGKAGVIDVLVGTMAAANQWVHIAVGRNSSNTSRLWVNGTSVATSGSDTYSFNAATMYIGSNSTPAAYLNGYMAGLRVVKGSDVYGVANTSITVPTAPFTAITNTQLLLNFTNAGITDATAKNDLETVGNAQISTTQRKWGGSSISFDGTGDYLYSISKPTTSLEGDFTIELWLYRNVSGNTPIFTLGDCFTANGFEIYIGSSGTQLIVFSGNASRITSATLPSVTTWAYLAATRSGPTVTLYLDGTSLGTWSSSSTFSGAVYVGTEFYNGSVSGSLNGYIQDLRITKGYARTITASPTAPFPVQ